MSKSLGSYGRIRVWCGAITYVTSLGKLCCLDCFSLCNEYSELVIFIVARPPIFTELWSRPPRFKNDLAIGSKIFQIQMFGTLAEHPHCA